MSLPDLPPIFFEIHSGLPQEAPGSNESTLQALSLIDQLPDQPKILDVGCGPGRQTLVLAEKAGGEITALDLHQPFLDDLRSRAEAAGVADRITTLNQSMTAMSFENESFDLVWSEGAIYIMGFETGLKTIWPLLKPGGLVAVSEAAWFTDQPSPEVFDFWTSCYPAITTVAGNLEIIRKCGYNLLGHFNLPDADWLDGYYGPVQKRIDILRQKYSDDPEALAGLDMEKKEIDIFRKYSAEYGYTFFVMRRPDA